MFGSAAVVGGRLNLLSAPTSIGLTHVGGGFDGRNELESHVSDTSKTNNATGNLAKDAAAEDKATEEDVD